MTAFAGFNPGVNDSVDYCKSNFYIKIFNFILTTLRDI
ncbi:hypothetical protein NQ535_18980 [[Clostridium] asparagiforme DSM 15981]|nr:hypothetical protein [Enterocloster asparagiformis]UWO79629.1 hypothetical protein NQ535_18980 [[Clostridium] asparagiforme DSM 15981]